MRAAQEPGDSHGRPKAVESLYVAWELGEGKPKMASFYWRVSIGESSSKALLSFQMIFLLAWKALAFRLKTLGLVRVLCLYTYNMICDIVQPNII